MAFETYLSQFPTSPRRDEAFQFASGAHDKPDYEQALQTLDNIVDPMKLCWLLPRFSRSIALWNCSKTSNRSGFGLLQTFALLQRGPSIEWRPLLGGNFVWAGKYTKRRLCQIQHHPWQLFE